MENKPSRILFVLLQISIVATLFHGHYEGNSYIYGNNIWAQGVVHRITGSSTPFVVPVVFCACCSLLIAPSKLPWIKSLLLLGSEAYEIGNDTNYLGTAAPFFHLYEIIIIVAMIIDCIANAHRALRAREASEPSAEPYG